MEINLINLMEKFGNENWDFDLDDFVKIGSFLDLEILSGPN